VTQEEEIGEQKSDERVFVQGESEGGKGESRKKKGRYLRGKRKTSYREHRKKMKIGTRFKKRG